MGWGSSKKEFWVICYLVGQLKVEFERPQSMVWKVGKVGCIVLYSDPIESATVDVKMFLTHAIYAWHIAHTLKSQPNMEILLIG